MKKAILVLFMAAASVSAFSFSARELLGEETYNLAKEKGKIQNNVFKGSAELSYTPKTELASMNSWGDRKDLPTLSGENLYVLSKADLNADVSKVTVENASVILRSISRMEGLQYFSNGDQKWETLYHDAYCIEGPKKRTKVADKTEGDADGIVQYCFLNDNSLGKTNYRVSYMQRENEVAVDFVNVTGIFIGPVKGVAEDNVHINLDLIDCGDEIVVYMTVRAKFLSIGFLEDRLQKSLLNRLEAIYGWFIDQFKNI